MENHLQSVIVFEVRVRHVPLCTLIFVHQTVATHFNSSQILIFLFEAFFDWQLLCAQLPD